MNEEVVFFITLPDFHCPIVNTHYMPEEGPMYHKQTDFKLMTNINIFFVL